MHACACVFTAAKESFSHKLLYGSPIHRTDYKKLPWQSRGGESRPHLRSSPSLSLLVAQVTSKTTFPGSTVSNPASEQLKSKLNYMKKKEVL